MKAHHVEPHIYNNDHYVNLIFFFPKTEKHCCVSENIYNSNCAIKTHIHNSNNNNNNNNNNSNT